MIKIKDFIEELREKASKDYETNKNIGGINCYGTGVEWGTVDACDKILKEMEERQNNMFKV